MWKPLLRKRESNLDGRSETVTVQVKMSAEDIMEPQSWGIEKVHSDVLRSTSRYD